MPSASQTAATVDDLHRAEGKAELIGGRIIHLMPTGFRPDLELAAMAFHIGCQEGFGYWSMDTRCRLE